MKNTVKYIGFPPPLLDDTPHRLEVLYEDEDIIAIEKPCDTLIEAHPWNPETRSMIQGLQEQLKNKKPELEEYNFEKPYTIYHCDYDTSGIAIIAKNKASCSYYRNLYGSYRITLLFHFLATSNFKKDANIVCGLPIAVHSDKKCMIVSNKTGKQARTKFDCIQSYGKYQLWQASTTYHRLHQVRIHALESGLNIIGDTVYNPAPKSKKHYTPGKYSRTTLSLPEYEHPHLHLANVIINKEDKKDDINIAAPLPRKLEALLNQIKKRHEKSKESPEQA